jgi:5-methylcytosine-specific restriction protein A
MTPKHRPPKEVWQQIRRLVWERDGGKCVRCGQNVTFEEFHCDHIKSGKTANNSIHNLRTLCSRCHVLRLDPRHRGMISWGLKKGYIPPNWREYVWDENEEI